MRGGTLHLHVLVLRHSASCGAQPAPAGSAWPGPPYPGRRRRRQHSARCGRGRTTCMLLYGSRPEEPIQGSGALTRPPHATWTIGMPVNARNGRKPAASLDAGFGVHRIRCQAVPGVATRQDGAAHCVDRMHSPNGPRPDLSALQRCCKPERALATRAGARSLPQPQHARQQEVSAQREGFAGQQASRLAAFHRPVAKSISQLAWQPPKGVSQTSSLFASDLASNCALSPCSPSRCCQRQIARRAQHAGGRQLDHAEGMRVE